MEEIHKKVEKHIKANGGTTERKEIKWDTNKGRTQNTTRERRRVVHCLG